MQEVPGGPASQAGLRMQQMPGGRQAPRGRVPRGGVPRGEQERVPWIPVQGLRGTPSPAYTAPDQNPKAAAPAS